MIVYSVAYSVPTEIVTDWEQFFLEEHLEEMVNSGHFTGYSFRKVLAAPDTKIITFIAEYYCKSVDDMKAYNELSAEALKAIVLEKFGDQFKAVRALFFVLSEKTLA